MLGSACQGEQHRKLAVRRSFVSGRASTVSSGTL